MLEEKMKVLGRNVLVEPILDDEVTENGIIVKRDVRPVLQKGRVLSKGDDIRCSSIEVGDTIYYHKMSGRPVDFNNKRLIVMDIIEVQAVEESD